MRQTLYPGTVERICPQCGVTFLRQPSEIKLGRGKYCERACYGAAKAALPIAERFWNKVNKNGPVPEHMPHLGACWLWTGATQRYGYGILGFKGRSPVRATRISWELHVGPMPEQAWALHHCDNPPCVRPNHLFLGDAASNSADMVAKGRNGPARDPANHQHGSLNGNAKLTEADVKLIRARYAAGGITQPKLAVEYSISRALVSVIITHKIWRHVA